MPDTIIINHEWGYEANRLIRSFFPPKKFIMLTGEAAPPDNYILTDNSKTEIKDGGVHIIERLSPSASHDDPKVEICRCLYNALSRYSGITLDWGLLTGIRPVKFVLSKRLSGFSDDYFTEKLLVNKEKLNLIDKIIASQEAIRKEILPEGFSLYVSIPFCPSRCDYCSFVSHSVEESFKLIPEYIDCLEKELEEIRTLSERLRLKLQSIYIGGGTPTAIPAEYLQRIFYSISKFDARHLIEYTLEAGRPETITSENLRTAKDFGVNRICVNPQTLSGPVLEKIGRRHTPEDFYQGYNIAARLSFPQINTDLIAGLPAETCESFTDTLNQIIKLSPTSVTLHCLTLKRSSKLYTADISQTGAVRRMSETGCKLLTENNYTPYYLYRQKNTIDSLENIGYGRDNNVSFYNIISMEDIGNILSAGCGGSTKLINSERGIIKRIYNHKYPYEYTGRFGEILLNKKEVLDFFVQL